MNVLVCIKQVPDTNEIKIHPVNNTLIRDGVPSIINPFDGYALEMALQVKDKYDAKVVVISMGPPQANEALEECLAVGADEAYLISDRAFGGSDTLATSYIISQAIKFIEGNTGYFDLIFCGKQAIDGDTGQVGPGIAEQLGYPQITFSTNIAIKEDKVRAERVTDHGKEIWVSSMPVVITAEKTEPELRYPTVRARLAAINTYIPVLGVDEISADVERSGLKGSPTKVKKSYVPPRKASGNIINEESLTDSARKLAALLSDVGLV